MSSQETILSYGDQTEPTDYDFDDFLIKPIPLAVAKEFFEEYHYSRGCGNSSMTWGVYHDPSSRLIGAIAFQTPISENTRASIFELSCSAYDEELVPSWNQCGCNKITDGSGDAVKHGYREHVTELQRLAIVPDAPKNTATWFISRALKRLKDYKSKYWAVISMADRTEGHDGTIYKAASADYYGLAQARVFYIDQEGRLRPPRQNGENITISEARERGWDVVKRETKHRYVFWLPDKYSTENAPPTHKKNAIRQMATVDLQEYPDEDENGSVNDVTVEMI